MWKVVGCLREKGLGRTSSELLVQTMENRTNPVGAALKYTGTLLYQSFYFRSHFEYIVCFAVLLK